MTIHIFHTKFPDYAHRMKVLSVAARIYMNDQGVCDEDKLELVPLWHAPLQPKKELS